MRIELKNIHYSAALSEETNAFSASLYIDGKRAGEVSNRGQGGSTDYRAVNEQGRKLIKEAERYCEKLPPARYPAHEGMDEYNVPMNLEHFIDDLLEDYLRQKDLKAFNAKLAKLEKDHIVFGTPDKQFRAVQLKYPVDYLLAHPITKDLVKNVIIAHILPEMKPGERILNKNIPESVFKQAGLTPEQYLKKDVTAPEKKMKAKRKRRL